MKKEERGGRVIVPLPDDLVRPYHCRFQELETVAGILPASVQLVYADIPYDGEFLKQVAELAAFAVRVLVRSGICAVMTGQYYFAEVMRSLGERLTWQWMRAMTWAGDSPPIHRLHITNHWKPRSFSQKAIGEDRAAGQTIPTSQEKRRTGILANSRLPRLKKVARIFTSPGDLVVDPCGGGFTTAVACKSDSAAVVFPAILMSRQCWQGRRD